MIDYKPISAYLLKTPIALVNSTRKAPPSVKLSSPAVLVMTDLRDDPAISIQPHVSIDNALERMKQERVRLLFVMDREDLLAGLITATDILGEKPVKLHQERNLRHDEIEVRDIMTPYHELEVLPMSSVLKARVGDIVISLQNSGRQHALITDFHPKTETEAIRGIFSTSQISRQLGQSVEMVHTARTFSELGAALNS